MPKLPGRALSSSLDPVSSSLDPVSSSLNPVSSSLNPVSSSLIRCSIPQTPENAKIILGTAIQHLQHSVKIWLQAAELETDVKARKRVLRRGTFPIALRFMWPSSFLCSPSPLVPTPAPTLSPRVYSQLVQAVEGRRPAGGGQRGRPRDADSRRRVYESAHAGRGGWAQANETTDDAHHAFPVHPPSAHHDVFCLTGIPDSVDLWLALARLESYEKARKVRSCYVCALLTGQTVRASAHRAHRAPLGSVLWGLGAERGAQGVPRLARDLDYGRTARGGQPEPRHGGRHHPARSVATPAGGHGVLCPSSPACQPAHVRPRLSRLVFEIWQRSIR